MRFKALLISLRTSLWLVPMLMVGGAALLAYTCIDIDGHSINKFDDTYPQPFAGGADSLRIMLSAIATSMITVSGITFSLTISALANVSGQLTARVIRSFMSNIVTKLVLGFFVGLFVYCIIVVRTIRIKDDPGGAFVPALSVFLGMALAIVGIGVMVYFIHFVAMSIQASTVVKTVTEECVATIDKLYPDPLPANDREITTDLPRPGSGRAEQTVPAQTYGYVQLIDEEKLRRFASDNQVSLRVDAITGDYVTFGSRLVSLVGPPQTVDADTIKRINGLFVVRPSRTIDEEIAYGIRQLVDIALKALAPASDDTTTAVLVLDNLTTVLVRLVQRQLQSPLATDYFMPKHPSFADLMAGALDQIREAAGNDKNTVVLTRMLRLLMVVGRQTQHPARQAVLIHHAQLVAEQADTVLHTDYQRGLVQQQLAETLIALGEKAESFKDLKMNR